MNAIDQLCINCGLCCNGVLFADVKLRRGDDARRLAGRGLALEKKGTLQAFAQPCACYDGKFCRIYAERPVRCRTFECGLLKRVSAGELRAAAALNKIARARRLRADVDKLLRCADSDDERLALSERYARAMRQPVDLAGGKTAVKLPGTVMQVYRDLMQVLQRDFLLNL
jgi:uncharacterized protein